MISTEQIRAARALLRWTAQNLADMSGVGVATIRRIELMDGVPSGQVRTIEALRSALEDAGVEFVGSSNDRPGVRLKLAGDK
jgi:transcriptional regulator with XRE-family HTH domain